MKYWLKGCSRCHGDLREESDIYGKYVACMQCGYILLSEEEQLIWATGKLEPEFVEISSLVA
jgi:DNA-directed RNA polymerase subunit RPC12/RpoP